MSVCERACVRVCASVCLCLFACVCLCLRVEGLQACVCPRVRVRVRRHACLLACEVWD